MVSTLSSRRVLGVIIGAYFLKNLRTFVFLSIFLFAKPLRSTDIGKVVYGRRGAQYKQSGSKGEFIRMVTVSSLSQHVPSVI